MTADERNAAIAAGLVVLLAAQRRSGAAPPERLVAPTTAPLASEQIAGWRWPLPTIALGSDGSRVDARSSSTIDVRPTISQGRSATHEGVDVDYRRPAGALPSLRRPLPGLPADRVVDRLRPTVYYTVDEWVARQDASSPGWRQRYAAAYLPRQVIGTSATPGGATPGDWADSRAGSRAYFCPPAILCTAVAAGRLWASGEAPTGHWVLIDHGTYTTWYGHLSSRTVPQANGGLVTGTRQELRIERGAALGVVGHDPSAPNTIRHLHLQVAHYPAGVRRVLDPGPSLRIAEHWIG